MIRLDFPVLPQGADRRLQLSDNGLYPSNLTLILSRNTVLTALTDGLLSDIIERLPDSKKYTVLYITSPREKLSSETGVYQSEDASYQDPLHMDLKRDFSAHGLGDDAPSNKTLFREYHYFTPGMCRVPQAMNHSHLTANRHHYGADGLLFLSSDLVCWPQCSPEPRGSVRGV